MISYKTLSIDEKKDIAKEIGESRLLVKDILNKFSISVDTYKKIQKEFNLPRKVTVRKPVHEIDHSFFDKIDTEEKAYWLGFLYADGCVSKRGEYHSVILVLKRDDRSHIEKFKKAIKTDHVVYDRVNNFNVEYSRIECGSKPLYHGLMRLGCPPKKTFKLIFPDNNQVPDHLIHHFMRGYFDGDGTINSHKEIGNKRNQVRFQVLGTKDFLKGFVSKLPLKVETKNSITYQKTKNIRTIQICGNVQSKEVFDFLYKDATVFLDRKYKQYRAYFS